MPVPTQKVPAFPGTCYCMETTLLLPCGAHCSIFYLLSCQPYWELLEKPACTSFIPEHSNFCGYKSNASQLQRIWKIQKDTKETERVRMREREREKERKYEEWITGNCTSQRQSLYYSGVFPLRSSLFSISLPSSPNSSFVCTSSVTSYRTDS